jgi:hypothetical protein
VQASVISLLGIALIPAGIAMAKAPPGVTITSPDNLSVTNDTTPSFSGTSREEGNLTLTLTIVSAKDGTVVEEKMTEPVLEAWRVTAGPLPDGVYTATASEALGATSEPVTFTIDTTPPPVALTAPANGSTTNTGSEEVAGAAGTGKGDLPTITIQLYTGPTIGSQAPLETVALQASNGHWSTTLGGLGLGVYTVRAKQRDNLGNTGTSAPATFTVIAAPPSSAPAAAFSWVPSIPYTGESISFVSGSTDLTSPITAYAWALESSGPFLAGNPLFTTSFATPGNHVVQLRVTNALGLSTVATQTVPVRARPLVLMQPFPIVRIAGSETVNGVKISLLAVQAPVGAQVSVNCRGRGCHPKSESRMAVASARKSRSGVVLLAFRPFEHSLSAGAVLRIRVSKPGEIGKYTSFAIRRGKLPARIDACLWPGNDKPIPCPAS